MKFHLDPRDCQHWGDEACRTCDFDLYYATNYPDCPWRKKESDD